MSFTDLLPSLVVGEVKTTESFLVVPPPKTIEGKPIHKAVRSFVLEWADTQSKEWEKIPGMAGIKARPVWGRDAKIVQELIDSCGEERLKRLAQLFWQHKQFTTLPKTIVMFGSCYDSLLELVSKITKEGMD